MEAAPVARAESTIAPPPLRRDAVPAASSVAADATPIAPQPSLLAQGSVGSPAAASSYGGLGSSASAAAVVPSPLASDTPGDRELEGTQTPTLTLEKRAPSEVSVGQAAPFKIIVRNVGNVTAHGVVVTDRVPQGVVYTTFHHPETGANVVTTEYSDWATNCPEYKVTAVQIMLANEPSRWQETRRSAHETRYDVAVPAE